LGLYEGNCFGGRKRVRFLLQKSNVANQKVFSNGEDQNKNQTKIRKNLRDREKKVLRSCATGSHQTKGRVVEKEKESKKKRSWENRARQDP